MATKYMSFEDAAEELQLTHDEVRELVSQGELRGIRQGRKLKFECDDVYAFKAGQEAEPTVILTDSDQELGIVESSDELILDESTSDTVLNLGDIMSPERQDEEEIVFSDSAEEFLISPHDSDPEAGIPTVQVPAVDEDLGVFETDSDAALIASQSAPELSGTTQARPIRIDSGDELIELVDDDVEDFDNQEPTTQRTASGRITRSARLKTTQVQQQPSQMIWSAVSLLVVVIMLLPGAFVLNRASGTHAQWVQNFADGVRGVLGALFEALMS